MAIQRRNLLSAIAAEVVEARPASAVGALLLRRECGLVAVELVGFVQGCRRGIWDWVGILFGVGCYWGSGLYGV